MALFLMKSDFESGEEEEEEEEEGEEEGEEIVKPLVVVDLQDEPKENMEFLSENEVPRLVAEKEPMLDSTFDVDTTIENVNNKTKGLDDLVIYKQKIPDDDEDDIDLPTKANGVRRLSERRRTSQLSQISQFRPLRSLYCLSVDNPIRRICITTTEWKPFEYFILANIFATCVVLAIMNPDPADDNSKFNMDLNKAEIFFTIVFTIEAIMKIIAMGFVMDPGTYLRNGWNVLDFLIVVIGIITLVFEEYIKVDIKALRAFRVLRPLRLVSGVPSLQVVITTIVKAMMPLFYISLLVAFVIIVYAVIGVEIFRGKLRQTCVNDADGSVYDFDGGDVHPCSMTSNGYPCPNGTTCLAGAWEGPEDGIVSFDNIFLACLTVFTCVTLEGWTDVMYLVGDTMGNRWSWIYFVTLVFGGSFFVLNLILGVLSGEFAKEKDRQAKSGVFQEKYEKHLQEEDFKGYIAWIEKAEDLEDQEDEDDMTEAEDAHRLQLFNLTRRGSSRARGSEGNVSLSKLTESLRMAFGYKTRSERIKHRLYSINKRLRKKLRGVVKSNIFHWAVIVAVFLNSLILAVEHYPEPEYITHFLNQANYFFLFLFTLEMIAKVYSLGPNNYRLSLFNQFDFFVVVSSLLEVAITTTTGLPEIGFSVLRCIRLLRVLKGTKHWDSLSNLINSLVNGIKSIASLLLLLFLFMVIFSLLGMQLFGGKFNFPEETPRSNFDTFVRSMLTVFQMLTGEDWNAMMYIGINAYGGISNTMCLLPIVYFTVLVVVGQYILLNVFLAIAVDNLADAENMTKIDEEEARKKKQLKEQKKLKNIEKLRNNSLQTKAIRRRKKADASLNEESVDQVHILANGKNHLDSQKDARDQMDFSSKNEDNIDPQKGTKVRIDLAGTSKQSSFDLEDEEYNIEEALEHLVDDDDMDLIKNIPFPMPEPVSLYLFSHTVPFRIFCHEIVIHSYFINFVLVSISISSLLLAAEDPLDIDKQRNYVLQYFDFIFTGIFTVEILIKVIAYGAFMHERSFCRNWFNLLDIFIVLSSVIAIILGDSKEVSVVRILRVVRVLRPLRAINRAPGLKRVVSSVLKAVKSIGNIALVFLLLMFMFSVIGVQLFKGTYSHCNDSTMKTEEECQGTYIEYKGDETDLTSGKVSQREWKTRDFNFDNIFQAALTLFVVMTFEGFPDIQNNAIDATEMGHGPEEDNRIMMALYFMTYIICIAFFMVNIFVGFVIVTFTNNNEEDQFKDCDLDKNEKNCIEYVLKVRPVTRFIPKPKLQHAIWKIVTSSVFEYLIFAFILGNTVILAAQYWDMKESHVKILEGFNVGFTIVFLCECVLKLFAFRSRYYFVDAWNVFDFLIVVGSILDILVTEVHDVGDASIKMNFFRLFRALRLLKLLSKGERIRTLIWTFMQSFQALPFVGLLVLLMFFIYAVIGMQIFGNIRLNENTEINRFNNFQTFPMSLLLLFRMSTGENWQEIMNSCLNNPSVVCEMNPEELCGNNFAYVYFITFNMVCSFLIINLFVAIIMENFDYLTRDWSILGPHHLDQYTSIWSEYDPDALGMIHHERLVTLLKRLEPPLGFGKNCPHREVCKRLVNMNMMMNIDGTVEFHTTLFALVRQSLGIKKPAINAAPSKEDASLRSVIKLLFPTVDKEFLDRVVPKPDVPERITIGKYYATYLIKEYFDRYKKKATKGCPDHPDEDINDLLQTVIDDRFS